MEDANIIVTLLAISPLAEEAFALCHNSDRYLSPALDNLPAVSRESTPFLEQDSQEDAHLAHRIMLAFDRPPRLLQDGYTFGYHPGCDVRLADRSLAHKYPESPLVSNKHFSITFDPYGRVILRDSSTHGTAVSYNGQGGDEVRCQFQWIVFPDFQRIEVRLPGSRISFRIVLGRHEGCRAQYLTNVDSILQARRAIEQLEDAADERPSDSGLSFPLQMLNVHSQVTTAAASTAITPRQRPIYLVREELGRGEFGTVSKVLDVSTGSFHAGKAFFQGNWAREVSIMGKVVHEHIVRFVDFRPEPAPLLIMEYLPLGNLEQQHRTSPLTWEDILALLVQALQATDHLHVRGLVHRDMKPANVLVASRDPLRVKIADFGLAKDDRNGDSLLKTCAGSPLYAAPEIWGDSSYSSAVDIWSLGVVVMEFAYGLPTPKRGAFNGRTWTRRISEAALACRGEDLGNLLSNSMLQLHTKQRLTAGACLEAALRINRAYIAEAAATRRGSSKRQRFPDSHSREGSESTTKTVVDPKRPSGRAGSYSWSYAVPDQPLGSSGSQNSMYETIVELLKELQVVNDGNDHSDLLGHSSIGILCEHLGRLEISEMQVHEDHVTGRTIVTAVTEARDFVLARFTRSDLETTVADLAAQLTRLLQLHHSCEWYESDASTILTQKNANLEDRATGKRRHVSAKTGSSNELSGSASRGGSSGATLYTGANPTSILGERSSQVNVSFVRQDELSCATDGSYSQGESESDSSYPITYPSVLLDDINISGCLPAFAASG